MINNPEQITTEQSQALMDAIAAQCDELNLTPHQILDGVARSLLGIAMAFDSKDVNVTVENAGIVNVKLFPSDSLQVK